MIARNEASRIAAALESVAWADERIVLDCGSQDTTADIAAACGARVYRAEHTPNLNVNKNRCLRLACGEWILLLDADERVSPQLAAEIQERISGAPREQAFWIPRRNWYFGHPLRYGRQYPDYQLRLFRRGAAYFPERHIHEYPTVHGAVGYLHTPLEHFPYETLSHYLQKLDRDTDFQARWLQQRYGAISLGKFFRHGLWRAAKRFIERYIIWGGFRDGFAGFWAAWLDGVNTFVTLAKWWHLSQYEHGYALSETNSLLR